jgi:hypothetical protein
LERALCKESGGCGRGFASSPTLGDLKRFDVGVVQADVVRASRARAIVSRLCATVEHQQ